MMQRASWLPRSAASIHNKICQHYIRWPTAFKWDWICPKMFKHLKDALKPEVLNSTLTLNIKCKSEMLQKYKYYIISQILKQNFVKPEKLILKVEETSTKQREHTWKEKSLYLILITCKQAHLFIISNELSLKMLHQNLMTTANSL